MAQKKDKSKSYGKGKKKRPRKGGSDSAVGRRTSKGKPATGK